VTLPPCEHQVEIVYLPPAPWPTGLAGVDSNSEIDTELGRRRMSELGVKVRIINPFAFPWNPLGKALPYLRGLDLLRTLRVLFTARKATAIVCVMETPALFLLLLRRLFFFRPKVLLWDANLGNPWKFLILVQRRVFPRVDAFMMLTTRQVELLKVTKSVRGNIQFIGHYVDDQFYHPKFNTTESTILSIGDDRSRDFATLLKTVEGTAHKVILKTRWKPDATPPQANVEFIGSKLSDLEFRGLYASASLVVVPLHPIDSPGGVNALIEAMAMGKAVIVSDSSVSRDFVTHGHDAWVVPMNDVGALRDAIERLMGDDSLRKSLADAARQTIETKFSSRHAAQRQLDAILRIVNTK
jgi:glycosyltransferase involved in cell wall biosynthesis